MNKLYRKIAAVLIIFLFIVISIIPVSGGFIGNKINSNTKVSSFGDSLFDGYMNLLMKLGHMPSMAICAIKEDEVVYSNVFGVYDIENNKVATEDTIYIIGSVSKTVTATAMMQIIENVSYGVDLDDNVSEYLPFNLKNPNYPDVNITFRMLLAHQSSLPYSNYFAQQIPGDVDIPSYPDPLLKDYLLPNGNLYAPDVWAKDRPGENFNYSNIGYGVIGYLIECISGMPFEEYCKQNIFIPLEMYNTSFKLADVDINRVAPQYEYFRGEHIRFLPFGWMPRACGNVRTTITDFSHFVIAHMNGGVYNGVRILKSETVELMHTDQYPGSVQQEKGLPVVSWGLGFMLDNNSNIHGETLIGHLGGYHSRIQIRPSDNTAIILFTHVSICPIRPSPITYDHSIQSGILAKFLVLYWILIQNALFRKASQF
jgi:CubicO group peptidase (beta-lactamase class C family)